MKVGTDGILLGAWSQTTGKKRALDIGTGTGLVALMLAQKEPSLDISALEIDTDALSQAKENIANSPWSAQVSLVSGDVIQWALDCNERFDLIVSNPPFFSGSLKSTDQKRNLARHNEHLSFEQLLSSAKKVVSDEGVFDLILPMSERENFLAACLQRGWYEEKHLLISHNIEKPPIRFLTRVRLSPSVNLSSNCLAIRNMDGGYSDAFKTLCRDYYLNF